MTELRLISFLPAATEMVFALGLGDRLVGVSHECDFPAPAKTKPVVVKPVLPLEKMSLREIDAAVAERIGSGQNLYQVDERLLEQLAPTHILTQALCQVCAPSGNEITRALAALPVKPKILWLTPRSIAEIFGNLRELGAATGRLAQAVELNAAANARLQNVIELRKKTPRRPRVFCLEWIDPYYCCGHWVPEMVELAGGEDALGRKGTDSVRVSWTDIAALSPEILVVSPCGFGVEEAVEQAKQLLQHPGWNNLPAALNDRVFAVNANAYFSRPGPRVVDGVELLAHLIHPELCDWRGSGNAFRQIHFSDTLSGLVRVKICPECGAEFSCGPKVGRNHCWCDELPALSPSIAPNTDCLCPTCLAKTVGRVHAEKS
jgi:iron complex transport system substrate-binding protein